MGTRSFIFIESQGQFRGIYCHWDGYLEGNGATLLTQYTTVEQVNALINGGNMSSLGQSVNDCNYYKDRGDKWENIEPITKDALADMVDIAADSGCEFVYLFKAVAEQWLYAERGAQFFGLSDGSNFSEFRPLNAETLIAALNAHL